MWDYEPRRERAMGRRAYLQGKRDYARFFELMLYGLGGMMLLGLAVSWLLHGFDGVEGAWYVPVAAGWVVAFAQWPAYFRRRADRRLREWENTLRDIVDRQEQVDPR